MTRLAAIALAISISAARADISLQVTQQQINPTLAAEGWIGLQLSLVSPDNGLITAIDLKNDVLGPGGYSGPVGISGDIHQSWTIDQCVNPGAVLATPTGAIAASANPRTDSFFMSTGRYLATPDPFTENIGNPSVSPMISQPGSVENGVNGTQYGVGSSMTFAGAIAYQNAAPSLDLAFVIVRADAPASIHGVALNVNSDMFAINNTLTVGTFALAKTCAAPVATPVVVPPPAPLVPVVVSPPVTPIAPTPVPVAPMPVAPTPAPVVPVPAAVVPTPAPVEIPAPATPPTPVAVVNPPESAQPPLAVAPSELPPTTGTVVLSPPTPTSVAPVVETVPGPVPVETPPLPANPEPVSVAPPLVEQPVVAAPPAPAPVAETPAAPSVTVPSEPAPASSADSPAAPPEVAPASPAESASPPVSEPTSDPVIVADPVVSSPPDPDPADAPIIIADPIYTIGIPVELIGGAIDDGGFHTIPIIWHGNWLDWAIVQSMDVAPMGHVLAMNVTTHFTSFSATSLSVSPNLLAADVTIPEPSSGALLIALMPALFRRRRSS